ncbi:MAG: hypothetical protein M3Z00_12670 [Actinomycetota bacterium]|nr:hypothetical protein [Actinomycetota bacterium]
MADSPSQGSQGAPRRPGALGKKGSGHGMALDEAAFTVICALQDATVAANVAAAAQVLAALQGRPVRFVGPRPGKEIDPLLTGRILLIGDDADLAAVTRRLKRGDLLTDVEVVYAPTSRTPAAERWSLPVGAGAVKLARLGEPDLIPVLSDDTGGVLIGEATFGPIHGTVFVDEYKVVPASARGLIVQPDDRNGLNLTVVSRRILGFGRRSRTHYGRATEITTSSTGLIADGVRRSSNIEHWTYYTHTQQLRLVRGVVD